MRMGASPGTGALSSATAAGAFAERATAMQEAREQRLAKLREEKMRLELQEATFRPAIRTAGGHGRRVSNGSGSASAAEVSGAGSRSGGSGSTGVVRVAAPSVPQADMGAAQMKVAASAAAKKESVGFKVIVLFCVFRFIIYFLFFGGRRGRRTVIVARS